MMVPRSLPITWTAMVSVWTTSRAGSASGQGWSATSTAAGGVNQALHLLGEMRGHGGHQARQHQHAFAPDRERWTPLPAPPRPARSTSS